jgi:hypothetical protein
MVGPAGRRDDAFCDVTMRQSVNLVIPDSTLDHQFRENPRVDGRDGAIRF